MPVRKEKLVGVCQDCQEQLRGGLTVKLLDALNTTKAMATGTLVEAAASHHDGKREWGDIERKNPQHDRFDVYQEGADRGELGEKVCTTKSVAAQSKEVAIIIHNQDISEALRREAEPYLARIKGFWGW